MLPAEELGKQGVGFHSRWLKTCNLFIFHCSEQQTLIASSFIFLHVLGEYLIHQGQNLFNPLIHVDLGVDETLGDVALLDECQPLLLNLCFASVNEEKHSTRVARSQSVPLR